MRVVSAVKYRSGFALRRCRLDRQLSRGLAVLAAAKERARGRQAHRRLRLTWSTPRTP